ncbi:MAG: tetratricopeptide repeat protein [Alphaproteobacteria bacterium]|nr:MAG: tetratricopeptide repeat protein [Alphaproteobacteria bacterium]
MMIRFFALSTMLAMMLVAAPLPAQARNDLSDDVERLTREVRALQRKVFGVDASGNVNAPAEAGAVNPGDRKLMADMAAQLGSLERQLRTLTGRLEEIEYKQRQFEDSLDLMQREMSLQRTEMSQAQADMKAAVQSGASQPAGTAPATAGTTQSVAPAVALPDGDAAAQYQYAFAFIQKNDLESGRIAMEQFLANNKDDSRVGNAKFWLGRIYMRQGKMAQAAQQLLGLIEDHPNHDKRADALVDLSEVLLDLGSAADACNALAEFRRGEGKANDRLKARAASLSQKAKCN